MITIQHRKLPTILGMALVVMVAVLGILFFRQSDAQQFKPSTKINSSSPNTYLVSKNLVYLAKTAPQRNDIPKDDINLIIERLVKCESENNEKALNKKDVDGTASYGILQFKPHTLYFYGKRYGFLLADFEENEIMNRIYEPDLQIATAKKMIEEFGHLESFWRQQFNICSKKMGLW